MCTQTLNYLRIVYAREWANFQERLISRADVRAALEQHNSSSVDKPTAADIREAAFLPGGGSGQRLVVVSSGRSWCEWHERTVHAIFD
jgi:hypothetical protein